MSHPNYQTCAARVLSSVAVQAHHTALCVSIQVFNTDLVLMVPTADLVNHSFQRNAMYALQAPQGFFKLKSRCEIKKGEAVSVSYGQDKTNAELMSGYGFIVPGNPQDRLDFTATAKPAELLFKASNALLTEEEGPLAPY